MKSKYPNFLNVAGLLTTLVGVAVTFIPEGLPLALGLTLTSAAKRMYKNKVLVRNLTSVETLGAVDVICSDKTGTLTQNKMSVGVVIHSNGIERENLRLFHLQARKNRGFLELLLGLSLCNNAQYSMTPSEMTGEPTPKIISGDASDSAILSFCLRFVNVQQVCGRSKRINQIPFNSRNKFMISINECEDLAYSYLATEDSIAPSNANTNTTAASSSEALNVLSVFNSTSSNLVATQRVLYIKGAAELILRRCGHMLNATGDGEELTHGNPKWERFSESVVELAGKGYRMLALAKTTLNSNIDISGDLDLESLPLNDLCFIGMVGLVDPPRKDVSGSIKKLHGAGVKVIMVTGDHPGTAAAIARTIGIIRSDTLHTIRDFNEAWVNEKAIPFNDDSDGLTGAELENESEDLVAKTNEQMNSQSVTSRFSFFDAFKNDTSTDHQAVSLAQVYPSSALAAITVVGAEIPSLTPQHWDYIFAHRDIVFARTTPEQKLRIVTESQARGTLSTQTLFLFYF